VLEIKPNLPSACYAAAFPRVDLLSAGPYHNRQSRTAFQDFLARCKEADPELSFLLKAKAEIASLK
jgi:hypothetical protein